MLRAVDSVARTAMRPLRVEWAAGLMPGSMPTTGMFKVRRFGASSVRAVDTRDYRRETGRVVRELIRCLHECDDVVVLLSSGGRRALFPILWLASSVLGVRDCFSSPGLGCPSWEGIGSVHSPVWCRRIARQVRH